MPTSSTSPQPHQLSLSKSIFRSPVQTNEEYAFADLAVSTLAAIGLAFISLIYITWDTNKEDARRDIFYRLVKLMLALSGLGSVGLLLSVGTDREEMYCRNNAVQHNSTMDELNSCTLQSIILIYTSTAITLYWFVVCLDLFVQIALRVKTTDRMFIMYITIVLVGPLITLAYLGSNQVLGYPGNSSWCTYRSDRQTPKPVLYGYYAPGVAIGIIGTVLVSIVLGRYFASIRGVLRMVSHGDATGTTGATRLSKKFDVVKVTAPIFIFYGVFCIVWASLLAPPLQFTVAGDKATKNSYDSWVLCLYDVYRNGKNYNEYKTKCGRTPYSFLFGSNNSMSSMSILNIVCIAAQSLLISLVALPTRLSYYCRRTPRDAMLERRAIWRKQMEHLAVAAARHRVLRSAVIWIGGGGGASVHPAPLDTGNQGNHTLDQRVGGKANNPIMGGESGVLFAVDVRKKPQGAGVGVGVAGAPPPAEENKELDEGEMFSSSTVNILGRQADSGHGGGLELGHGAQNIHTKYRAAVSGSIAGSRSRGRVTNATLSTGGANAQAVVSKNHTKSTGKSVPMIGADRSSSAFIDGFAAARRDDSPLARLRTEGAPGGLQAFQSGDHNTSSTGSDMLLILPDTTLSTRTARQNDVSK